METITKECQYCGKEMKSLYQKQIDFNMDTHEKTCKENPKNKNDALSQSNDELQGESEQ